MERKFKFNYNTLNKYIEEWQKDKNRTDWELTILRDNFKNLLVDVLNKWKEYIISINESTWEVTINWKSGLEDQFYMIPSWYPMSNKSKLYRQIKGAMDEAENYWIYDEIFEEIE